MPLLRILVAIAAAFIAGQSQAADLPGPIIIKQAIVTNNPCVDPMVRRRIAERFAWAERHTWHRGFVMASLENGRAGEHPFFEPGIIHREYCMADAKMTDGTARTVYFTIEFGQGLASMGSYVDFCVLGLDPWRVHDEACRTVR
jgi:hypothetical protein